VIHPQPARWFEILVAPLDAMATLEALARSNCVEFDARLIGDAGADAASTAEMLREYAKFAKDYRAELPAPSPPVAEGEAAPATAMRSALGRLQAWAQEAAPMIEKLRKLQAERASLGFWSGILEELRGSELPLDALADAELPFESALFVFPEHALLAIPGGVIAKRWVDGAEEYALCFGTREAMAKLADQVSAANGRKALLPGWLRATPAGSAAIASERIAACDREVASLRVGIDALHAAHRTAQALGVVMQSVWRLSCSHVIEEGDIVCRIGGWTSDPERLAAVLDESTVRAVAHFPAPPAGVGAPLILSNPWWARPFELFTRLLGIPSRHGADPTALLAFIAPLLFGYMFGDVGQGLLLAALGAALGRRWSVLKLLVPAGIAAAAFGLVFGHVFGMESVVPALWVRPLEDPLPVLLVPIGGGAVLLILGLALGAIEARWAGATRQWLLRDSWVLLAYLGVLASLLHPAALALIAAGVAGSVLGPVLVRRSLREGMRALGSLLEKSLQLVINTLSFVRVGAFALAHAGLSAAVMALSESAGSVLAQALILVLGNVVVMAVEVLLVSVQTARLILFEFFVRFFATQGREFRPLRPPSFSIEETQHEPHG